MKSFFAVMLAVTLVSGFATSASARRVMDVNAQANLISQQLELGSRMTASLSAGGDLGEDTNSAMPGCTSRSLCNLTSGAACCSCALGNGARFGPARGDCSSAEFWAFVDIPGGLSPVSLLRPPRS